MKPRKIFFLTKNGYLWMCWVFVAVHRLSSWSSWALERRLSSCGAPGLAAPWHVGSSRSRDQTQVPCIHRRILNHWTTKKVHNLKFSNQTLNVDSEFKRLRAYLELIRIQLGWPHVVCGLMWFVACRFVPCCSLPDPGPAPWFSCTLLWAV